MSSFAALADVLDPMVMGATSWSGRAKIDAHQPSGY